MADITVTVTGDFEASKRRLVGELVAFQKRVVQTIYANLVTDSRKARPPLAYGSPVWTGRYRGSFRVSIGSIDRTYLPPYPNPPRWPTEPANPYRNVPASQISLQLAGLRPFQTVYISNAVPYVRRIERGYSRTKAPSGVFQRTIDNIMPSLRAQARAVNTRIG